MLETDSPDLGSPPVAHFETTEPFVYDAPECMDQVSEERNQDGRDISPTGHFTNLETRRKRRTSTLMRQSAEESDSASEAVEVTEACPSEPLLKIGAKRKFGSREQAHEVRPVVPEVISFSFSRKSALTVEKPAPERHVKPLPERNVSKVAERARTIVSEVKARKALSESKFRNKSSSHGTCLHMHQNLSTLTQLCHLLNCESRTRNQIPLN